MLSALRSGGVRFGAEGRIYPNQTGFTKSANTVSFLTSLGMPAAPLAPKLMFVYDVGGITGPYFEGEVRQVARVGKGVAFILAPAPTTQSTRPGRRRWPALHPTTERFTHLDLTRAPW